MRSSPLVEPRQRYRADFDEACARGYVDSDQVARGVNPAWLLYLRCAEMCERPSEEWELQRVSIRTPNRIDVELIPWVQVIESVRSRGARVTCQVALVSAADAALAERLVVLSETPPIPEARLVAGYQFRPGGVPSRLVERYVGLRFTTAGGRVTAGRVMAGINLPSAILSNRQSLVGPASARLSEYSLDLAADY